MFKKAALALLAALVSCVMMGSLIGCGNDAGDDTPSSGISEILEINTLHQTLNDIVDITNFQIVYKYTYVEWNALSDAEKERLAKAGFEQASELIRTDGVSNYNINGMSVPGEDADGNPLRSQQLFALDLEESALVIWRVAGDSTPPEVTATISVELPLS